MQAPPVRPHQGFSGTPREVWRGAPAPPHLGLFQPMLAHQLQQIVANVHGLEQRGAIHPVKGVIEIRADQLLPYAPRGSPHVVVRPHGAVVDHHSKGGLWWREPHPGPVGIRANGIHTISRDHRALEVAQHDLAGCHCGTSSADESRGKGLERVRECLGWLKGCSRVARTDGLGAARTDRIRPAMGLPNRRHPQCLAGQVGGSYPVHASPSAFTPLRSRSRLIERLPRGCTATTPSPNESAIPASHRPPMWAFAVNATSDKSSRLTRVELDAATHVQRRMLWTSTLSMARGSALTPLATRTSRIASK